MLKSCRSHVGALSSVPCTVEAVQELCSRGESSYCLQNQWTPFRQLHSDELHLASWLQQGFTPKGCQQLMQQDPA